MKRWMTLLAACVLLNGCAVKFPQYDRYFAVTKAEDVVLADIMWYARLGDANVQLIPIVAGSGTVYVSLQDDGLFFDGYRVTRIIKFPGIDQKLELVPDDASDKQWSVEIAGQAKLSISCGAFNRPDMFSAWQQCQSGGKTFTNRLHFNARNELVSLRQFLPSVGQYLELSKAPFKN